jgi:hypothetical protein
MAITELSTASHFTANVKKSQPSYMSLIIEIQQLVSQIFRRQDQISDNKTQKMENLKSKFYNASQKSADFTRKDGKCGFYTAAASVGLIAASTFFPKKSLSQGMLQSLSSQASPLTGLISSGYRAEIRTNDNISSLKIQEITAQSNETQSSSELRQVCSRLLDSVLELYKKLSQ